MPTTGVRSLSTVAGFVHASLIGKGCIDENRNPERNADSLQRFRTDPKAGLRDVDGFSAETRAAAQLDFALDFADRLRRNADEFHADPDPRQAIADFTASAYLRPGKGQAETEIEDCTF